MTDITKNYLPWSPAKTGHRFLGFHAVPFGASADKDKYRIYEFPGGATASDSRTWKPTSKEIQNEQRK